MARPALALLVIAAIGSGLIYYLFLMPVGPAVVPLKPSAHIPTFQRVNPDGTTDESPFAPPRGEAAMKIPPQNPARYAGLSPRQTGKAADEACFALAHAKFPHWSKTPRLTTKSLSEFALDDMPHFNELMNCLLTEAPVRYCSSSQRNMIATEIGMYFRVLEYGNKGLAQYRDDIRKARQSGKFDFGPDIDQTIRMNQLEYAADPRILAAIDARLRDGTLSASDRDAFAAAAPPPIRQRFARVKPSTPLCPAQPWWAFWRTF